MPYPKGHKLKVRNHIITSAAKAFRTHGVRNISLPHIMKGAGLTHGGFYSHFENKDQLVMETCHFAISDTIEMLQRIADHNKNEDQTPPIEAVIDFYLSPLHRDQTEAGCILPALSGKFPSYRQISGKPTHKSFNVSSHLLQIWLGSIPQMVMHW